MNASRNPKIRLLHIRDEIEAVLSAIGGADFETYRGNYALRRASERAVQIISEAAKALPPELTDRYPDVPWSAIVGIGNVLRHEYQHIDDRRLWQVVTIHLIPLRNAVVSMLAEWDEA